jgi:outer membrane lipoprotein-sorting protein
MMKIRRLVSSLLFAAAIGTTALPVLAQPKPGHLDEVLRQMDASSAKFKSAEADFRYDLFERVVKQTTSQTGITYILKNGTKTEMGAKFITPAPKFLDFRDDLFRMYEPDTNHLTTFSSGKNRSQIESFLTLGFGASGKDLARAWTISDLGMETIDGVETAKLDLVPKDANVHQNVTHIIVWIDPVRDVALKQEFFLPSDDTKTCFYTSIRLNQKIDMGKYQLKTNGKTTKDEH